RALPVRDHAAQPPGGDARHGGRAPGGERGGGGGGACGAHLCGARAHGRTGRRRAGGVWRDGRARPAALHRLPPALRAHLGPPPGRHRGRGGARQEADMTPPLAWYLGLSAVLFAIGVLFNLFCGGRLTRAVTVAGPGTVGAAFVLAVWAALRRPEAGALHDHVYTWIVAGPFRAEAGLRLDALATVMTLVVTGVGFLIHIYSVGYMHGDRGFARYF